MSKDAEIVYSTEFGKMCPKCGQTAGKCECDSKKFHFPEDGIVRVRREIKGRRGKTVTMIYGFSMDEKDLHELASEMKRRLGTGGSVKDGVILIQGDRCDAVIKWIEQKGYQVKKSGG